MTQTGMAMAAKPSRTSWLRERWNAATGIVGLAPNVLHHVWVLAGTALAAGSGGAALFGALGLVPSVPVLLRPRRRFGNWTAPAIGLADLTAMFALSTWVTGPAISSSGDSGPAPSTIDHGSHHETS